MLDFFLELEVLWLLTMLHLINNAINYVLQFLNSIAQLKFEFKKKINFLKIHIKDGFSILFSPIIDG